MSKKSKSANKQVGIGFGIQQHITNLTVDEKYLNEILTMSNHPSVLNMVVLELFNNINDDNFRIDLKTYPHPEVENKILYNNITKYRFKIETLYSENAFFIEEAYNSLDYESPGNKKLLLNYLNSIYLEVLGSISNDVTKTKIEIIKENNNGDSIIEQIISRLLVSVSSLFGSVSKESLILSITIIVYHAFVECKILENPNK
ncbi:hypothetical protein [Chryseobacterium arthrosphaerae]|uniref:hypothetical protein n=1 Tax=Chryseobacterium arthrosphaerae TaxID=651561 RepID=UPI003D356329